MDTVFDPLNLLILAIAVVIFWRLRSVLGRRTGTERPPFDPYAARRAETRPRADDAGGKVITLPRELRDIEKGTQEPEQSEPVWKGIAEEGSSLAEGLEKIVKADSQFSPKSFLDGARVAYEMIVNAFAQGDKASLRDLVSSDVYEGFASAIDTREKQGEKLESRFVGIDKADIVGAELQGKRASVTVKFVSQLISATLNKLGEVIDGDPKQIREITDVWTFERDTASRDPNWRLVATEAPA